MTPYFSDEWIAVYAGDCRAVLAELPAASVHTVVTSPPYWGLRDYGTATWVGGDEACDHSPLTSSRSDRPSNGLTGGKSTVDAGTVRRGDCGKCGAVRVDGQIGLEPTPEAYVETMVAVFREVRRVLRDDGTVWLNLGDSYVANAVGKAGIAGTEFREGSVGPLQRGLSGRVTKAPGLKPKDLVGIPWRVAFALQADGWYLRSDVVWSKPNPMPESVTDRPTKSHEYVFLLSKRERYYFDADAVRERNAISPDWNYGSENYRRDITQDEQKTAGDFRRPKSSGAGWSGFAPAGPNGTGRNLRSVWTIATQPYPGAHFATFPEALVEPCVKAGTSERGVCPDCGAPWVRVTERVERDGDYPTYNGKDRADTNGLQGRKVNPEGGSTLARFTAVSTGWRASCRHDAEPIPATVLDPFAGSGTTGRVAQRLGRRAVLVDLSPAYLLQALKRNGHGPDEVGTEPMFDQSPLWGGEAA